MSGTGISRLSGRRAVVRWAWRLYRREWRQQIWVLALLTFSIAATVVGMSAAYNLGPVRGNAELGTASRSLWFNASDPQSRDALLESAESWFGSIDVITRRGVAVPGAVDSIELRSQDPRGAFSGPMLALLEGRYPTGADEVAVTNSVAETFALDIGGSIELGGEPWTVVGLVENPSDLGDEFALVAPSQEKFPQTVMILVDADTDRVESFMDSSEIQTEWMGILNRPSQEAGFAVVIVLIIAVVTLLLVSLVAAAGFVAVAQRRLRQLGMLAAIGATEAHLRLVTVANGVVIGALAALLGGAAGAAAWVLATPLIETAAGHRIDRFNVPWWLLAAAMVLALVTATAAAWWPARTLARVSVVRALSGRPPAAQPAHRSGALAGLLIATGFVFLAWADPSKLIDEEGELGDLFQMLLIAAGTLATVVGVLFISPLVIRALAATARWLPVAMRLALRDLVRFQARSGAALAAISLALGIASALIVTAAAAEPRPDEGNLSDRQLLVWTRDPDEQGPVPAILAPADLAGLKTDVEAITAVFDEPSVIPFDVAVRPAVELDSGERIPRLPAALLAEDENGEVEFTAEIFAAGSEVLEHYGIDLDAVPPETEVLTVETGDVWIAGNFDPTSGEPDQEAVSNVLRLDRGYSSVPGTFITSDALRRRGWVPVRAGWFIQTDSSITSEQLVQARQIAADAGLLVIEARSGGGNLVALRWPATAAGMLVALSILAMTVGLIRGESAGDLRTLTATGATSTIRRTLTAVTAGALALLGVTLGAGGAYISLAALYLHDLGALSPIPVLHLVVLALGVPLAAAGAGWLLAGREPTDLARQPIE